MNEREIVRRLRAYAEGAPVPIGSTVRVQVAEEGTLFLAFIRMGGESSPWAIGWKLPGNPCRCLTVPEARNRDLVAQMLAGFAPTLLEHLLHPAHASPHHAEFDEDEVPHRQVWLPNGSHIEMLHFLGSRYTFARRGPKERVETLNALGRACSWLFRESTRPDQMTVFAATDVLRSAYSFPADDMRQGHLGFLMAWLSAPGNRQQRQQLARAAEKESISTLLDPSLERDPLAEFVADYHDVRSTKSAAATTAAEKKIAAVLRGELTRRLELTEAAWERVIADERPYNTGLEKLVSESTSEMWWKYLRYEYGETPFVPSPETDRSAPSAANNYERHERAAQRLVRLLAPHDDDMIAEMVAGGDGFSGVITEVEDRREGRALRPIWRVESDAEGPLRLRRGSTVAIVGRWGWTGNIEDVAPRPHGGRVLRVKIQTGQRKEGPPNNPRLVGSNVVLLAHSSDFPPPSHYESGGPGAWLTHGMEAE